MRRRSNWSPEPGTPFWKGEDVDRYGIMGMAEKTMPESAFGILSALILAAGLEDPRNHELDTDIAGFFRIVGREPQPGSDAEALSKQVMAVMHEVYACPICIRNRDYDHMCAWIESTEVTLGDGQVKIHFNPSMLNAFGTDIAGYCRKAQSARGNGPETRSDAL